MIKTIEELMNFEHFKEMTMGCFYEEELRNWFVGLKNDLKQFEPAQLEFEINERKDFLNEKVNFFTVDSSKKMKFRIKQEALDFCKKYNLKVVNQ